MMLDESNKELSVRAMKGMHKTLQEIFRVRPGEGIAGQVYQSGNPPREKSRPGSADSPKTETPL